MQFIVLFETHFVETSTDVLCYIGGLLVSVIMIFAQLKIRPGFGVGFAGTVGDLLLLLKGVFQNAVTESMALLECRSCVLQNVIQSLDARSRRGPQLRGRQYGASCGTLPCSCFAAFDVDGVYASCHENEK